MADKKDAKAKPDKKAKGAKPASGAARKSGGKRRLFAILVLVVGCVFPSIGIVILAGMLPSFAMSFSDRSRGKSLTVCVGVLNAVGVFQMLVQLSHWGIPPLDPANGMRILTDPQAFIVMWGAAAVGFGLFSFVPGVVAHLLVSMAQMKITRLRANQKELKRIWGDDVER